MTGRPGRGAWSARRHRWYCRDDRRLRSPRPVRLVPKARQLPGDRGAAVAPTMFGALLARSRARRVPRAFGLDIASTAVKVVEVRDGDPRLIVTRCAIVPLPAASVAAGAIRDPEAAAATIREAVTAAGIAGKEAVVGICGRELI